MLDAVDLIIIFLPMFPAVVAGCFLWIVTSASEELIREKRQKDNEIWAREFEKSRRNAGRLND